MKKRAAAATVILGLALPLALRAAPLTSLAAVHQLTNQQASAQIPVDFDATVTFYRSYEGTLFVQDGDVAIYVQPARTYSLTPGDRVHIHGVTHQSFRPFVGNAEITVVGRARLPYTPLVSFDGLIHAQFDCRYVRLRGRVLSADIVMSSDRPSTNIQLQLDGGTAGIEIESNNPDALPPLLDAEVEVAGAVSGRFDGKMEMTGIVLHMQSPASLRVIKSPTASPRSAPLIPMNEIISEFRAGSQSNRVHVQGTVTYFIPGSAVVLQNGSRSLWINTRSQTGVHIGDHVDATGFPDVHDGFLRLANGEIFDSHTGAPIRSIQVPWRDLTQSRHVFDLVSIDASVVAEVREGGHDEYVLVSDGHLFSAIFRHPAHSSASALALPAMKRIPAGARVRVSGICILEDSNPFNVDVPFDLLMRSYDDIAVVAQPSLVTVANLIRAVGLLAIMVVAIFAWGWMLKRKVQRQTKALAGRIEAEAAMERHNALIEQRRSGILEDISGSRPLVEVLEEITELVSFRLHGAPCWCEVTDGATLGNYQSHPHDRRMVREEIPARSGPPLGYLCAALELTAPGGPEEEQAFFQGTRLATLAIETRKAYSDLVHRSEFDLLTDVHNRFSLDKQLDVLIARAREQAGIFGLIYVDLDEFKQVNDVYGHHVGDLYLQEVCARMKHQLRSGDILARVGGDEFAAIVPSARNREDVEEIASRLERCFDEPFPMQGYVLRGSASIGTSLYPEDGTTRDSLLTAADAAMYVSKHMRRES
jgi:diguanylate cyclase (GGDEF)-like protein